MDIDQIIRVLLSGNQLKRTPRTGWIQRGIANAENVAAHSFGVAYTTLILAHVVQTDINLERALAMAILHDVPEGKTTDIPTTAWFHMPAGIKEDVERGVMNEIVGDAEFSKAMLDWWVELTERKTAEAKLVHDADKIDMLLQSVVYEKQTGNRQLEEFWTNAPAFYYETSKAIADELHQRRPTY